MHGPALACYRVLDMFRGDASKFAGGLQGNKARPGGLWPSGG